MPTLVFSVYDLEQMFERTVSVDDVRGVLAQGETIEDYPNDTPYPSRLVLGFAGTCPLHVMAADNAAGNETIIVTVYKPDLLHWQTDWKTRK